MAEKSVKKREDISNEYKWAIEDLYADDKLWSKDYEKVLQLAEEIKAYQGRLSESPEVLCEFMKKYEEMEQLAEKVYVYANQRLHEDTGNSYYQGLAAKTQGMLVVTGEATSFFEPEFLEMPEENYQKIVTEERL